MTITGVGAGLMASHVSLHEAAANARGLRGDGTSPGPVAPNESPPPRPQKSVRLAASQRASATPTTKSAQTFEAHTPVVSHGPADRGRWDEMLNRLGQKYNVPPLFLKAVMLAESGGRPDAVGDSGHSVGLFQLHDQGYGSGMGDARFDPATNAERATRGLADAWHAGEKSGLSGERAVRAAYDYSFNPGGGWAYQGDGVVRIYNALLSEQSAPPLS